MPWTPRQVHYLEPSGSPLTAAQKDKMNSELHENPALGRMKKGSAAMKQAAPHKIHRMEIEIHRGPKNEVTGHTVHHHMMPSAAKNSPSGAFQEQTHHAFPFDAHGESSTHGNMMEHIGEHLGILGHAAKDVAREENEEPEEEETE